MKKKFLILTLAVLGFSNYAAAAGTITSNNVTQQLQLTVLSSDIFTLTKGVLTGEVQAGGATAEIDGENYELSMGGLPGDRTISASLQDAPPAGMTVALGATILPDQNGVYNGSSLGLKELQKATNKVLVDQIQNNSTTNKAFGSLSYAVSANFATVPNDYVIVVQFLVEAG